MPDPDLAWTLAETRKNLATGIHGLYVLIAEASDDEQRALYRNVHSACAAMLASLFDAEIALVAKQQARETRGLVGVEPTDEEVSDVYETMTMLLVPEVLPPTPQALDT
jgi:hypothetical protein